MNSTKLILEHIIDGKKFVYSIESNYSDLVIDDFIDSFIKPLCLAAGFHPQTVEDYFENK